jgi:hypothetical protein
MPIKPRNLPSPEPDDRTPEEIAGKVEHDDLAESNRDPQTPGTGEEIAQEEQTKRKRRSKAEMIADAVVPADDEPVEIKDALTGAKITRPWSEAVALVKAGTSEWADKAMKYAVLKAEQASGGPASQEPMGGADTGEPSAQTSSPATHDASGQRLAPEGAELGDEVVIGSETYIVGHGGVLVQGVVAVGGEIVKPKRRWQRELGAGSNGPWESRTLLFVDEPEDQPAAGVGKQIASELNGDAVLTPAQNGVGSMPVVWREFLPDTFEKVGPGEWKVGTGVMDKIGLPSRGGEWSSLTVGPCTASRTFPEDGEYTKVKIGDREEIVPVAGLRYQRMCRALVEIDANSLRGELTTFLATQGVVLSPLAA